MKSQENIAAGRNDLLKATNLRILYITDRDDAPYRYRCVHACEQLRESGIIANIKRVNSPDLLKEIPRYSIVVLFRLAWNCRIEEIINTAKMTGVPLAFDIDDVIFDPEIEAQIPFFRHLPGNEVEKYRQQFHRLHHTLLACDFCIASTPTIAQFAAREGIKSVIHPNLLSRTYVRLSSFIYPLRPALQNKPFIGYMSGSNTHDGDLESITAPLTRVLKERPTLSLIICGYIGGLSSYLKSFSERIQYFAYQDHRVYPWLMARCRALLAPVEIINDFTNAKSALKVFEAGVFGIPVVASPTTVYSEAISHGLSGFLASSADEWTDALLKLSDKKTSLGLGAEARKTALEKYSPDAFRNVLALKLAEKSGIAVGEPPLLESLEKSAEFINPDRSTFIKNARMIGASVEMAIHPAWRSMEVNKCNQKSGIDIVIPIYNARAFVIPCIESVLKYATGDFRLILVDDASSEPGLSEELRNISMKDEREVLLVNENNLGFVGTANRGMQYAIGRDVLLLNSDTEVFSGFLERIQSCAYTDGNTGIVSPFSNNATICSIPEFLIDNQIPEGFTAASFSELVTTCSRCQRPELVTAVGFCMYIKTSVFEKIGYFDKETFKRGFGEENDFCERAKKAGFKIRLADDVFVYHKGKASFGDDGFSMENQHACLLESKHPDYHLAVAHFIETNPLASIHEEIRFNIMRWLNAKHGATLYVLHSSPYAPLPGGTELHVLDLIRSLASPRAVIMFPVGSTIEFAEIFNGHVEMPLFYSFSLKKRADRFCFEHPEINHTVSHCIDLFGITSVHIHHLMNWPVSLGTVFRDKGIPYIYTSHDYYAACPDWNLFDYTRMERCGFTNSDEPACRSCLSAFFKNQGDFPPMELNKFKDDHRKSFMATLSGAQSLLFPSMRSRQIISEHLPIENIKREVIEHGYDSGAPQIHPHRGQNLKIGILGQISYPIKGAEQYIDLVKRCRDLPVEWHFAGATSLFGFEQKIGALGINQRIHFHGPYKREDVVNMLAGLGIDLVAILPICEETYSYILTEALSAGVPVIVSNHGALKERVERDKSGFVVSSAEEAAEILENLCYKPAVLEKLTEHIRSLNLPSHAQNALEHKKIYKDAGFDISEAKVLPLRSQHLHELFDQRKDPVVVTLPGDALHKYQHNPLYPYFLKIRHLVPKSFRRWGKTLLIRREKHLRRKFDFGRSSVSAKGLRLINREPHAAKYESLTNDPQFILKNIPFPSNAVRSIRFRISRNMPGYAFSQIYWIHAAEESFSEQKSAKIFLNSKTNVMMEYILDLEAHNLSAWHAGPRISRLRFDPINLPGIIEVGTLELCT